MPLSPEASRQVEAICKNTTLHPVRLARLVERHHAGGKRPSRQELIDALRHKPKIQQRAAVLSKIKAEIAPLFIDAAQSPEIQLPKPALIGSTELWLARLTLPSSLTSDDVQRRITNYVEKSGQTIIGYVRPLTHQLTLLRWPDQRPGFKSPSLQDCETTSRQLAALLQASAIDLHTLRPGVIHCMMGRRVDGYTSTNTASLKDISDCTGVTNPSDVVMVSARPKADGSVESYTEPATALIVTDEQESILHKLGDTLQQHHYVLERGSQQRTDFYQTPWADNAAST